ncbi:lysophospholipid acyltransferase [soil metagenome]
MTFMTRRAVAREVLNSPRVEAELAIVAGRVGKPLARARHEAEAALQTMVSVQTRFFGLLHDRALGPLHARAWSLDVDGPALTRLQQTVGMRSLVFLPTHRSYADHFILGKVLRLAGMPRTYVLGGDNLGFFPIGTIGRRAGAVFIRRSFRDDEVYKLALREYMRYLVASGASLEWYMEGGRSRTGKLRRPRYGLLRYLMDAIDSGGAADIVLVPVSITYDQLQEVAAMASEEAGATKAKEGLRWLVDYVRRQSRKLGRAYVRFGEPFSLGQVKARGDGRSRWTLDKTAFEVFQRINRVTPVTAPALVSLALLSVEHHALTLREVRAIIDPLLHYAARRDLPTTALDCLQGGRGLEAALEALVQSGVVARRDDDPAPVFHIRRDRHAIAAFYRNSAIHWFVNRAIVELAIMAAAQSGMDIPLDRGWIRAFAFRDLLKFEFFFSEKVVFQEEIAAEVALLDPTLLERLPERSEILAVLERAPFLMAHRVLPAFLEAYFVVADRLAAHALEAEFDEKAFLAQCVEVGRHYLLQGRLRHPESVSRELFGNALALAGNSGLLQAGTEAVADGRRRFAEEIVAALAAVAAIGDLDDRLRRAAPSAN